MITAITEKKSSEIIWKPLSSDRIDNDRWDRTFYISAIAVAAIAGEWFHMIDVFFFSAMTAMVAIIWKPGFNLIMAYFKRKDCLQRNLYLNCVSLMKKPWRLVISPVWPVSISAVVWSSLLISVTRVELLWAVYKFFQRNNINLKSNVRLSGAENITSHDETAPPSFTSR